MFELGFYVPKLHLGYEAHCSGGLQINLDHLGIFEVRQNLVNKDIFIFPFFFQPPTENNHRSLNLQPHVQPLIHSGGSTPIKGQLCEPISGHSCGEIFESNGKVI